MNKPLLLCLFMALYSQLFAQDKKFQGFNEARANELITSGNLVPLPAKEKAPIKTLQELYIQDPFSFPASKDIPEFWPDRLFIKLKKGQDGKLKTFDHPANQQNGAAHGKLNKTLKRHQALSVSELPRSQKALFNRNAYEVVLEKPGQMQQLMQELKALPEVEYVERVPYYVALQSPNDPSYLNNSQYALHKTKAAEAYAIHTGTSRTLLAIVDDAVLISHPDLAGNINTAKSYDVADKDTDPRPPSTGANKAGTGNFSHGTHCAGIAGAVTNNGEGVAAISNNKVSIIGVKCTRDAAPSSRVIEYAADGMIYAINQGARVISMSYGGTGYSQTIQNIINEATANGVVFVAAAGNDNSENKMYPAAYDNVIAVASTDANDLKSSFSNYGNWVDISAPGSAILSTVTAEDGTSGAYNYYSGTSMACPMVASLVALMLSENPNLTPLAVVHILKNSADPLENVQGQSVELAGKLGGGRINAYRAIQAVKGASSTAAPAAITDLHVTRVGQTELEIAWTAPDAGGTAASQYDIRYATAPITAANFEHATKTKQSIFPGAPGQPQQLVVKELAPGTTYYIAIVAKSFYGDSSPLSNVASASTLSAPLLQITPASFSLNLNRTNSSSATRNFLLTNQGNVRLDYTATLVPVAGSNILQHDKQQQKADNSVGLGGDSFHSAARFVAGARGFNLTHVQNFLYSTTITGSVNVGIRILKGGTTPASATLLHTETATTVIPAGGRLSTFPLQAQLQFAPGEVFWIVFVLPTGVDYPQGFDTVSPNPGTFFLSIDNGKTYEDAQTLASFLSNAAFKIRAANADWVTLNPTSGNILPGDTKEVSMGVDITNLQDGTYQVDASFQSNDPLHPVMTRPLTLTVTGGLPKLVMEPAEVNWGTLFVGTSRTVIVRVANTGLATLTLQTDAVNTGEFAASDVALSTQAPIILAPGKQQELQMTFTPSKEGLLNGGISYSSNDPEASMITVPLTAQVVSPPVSVVTPAVLNFELDYSGRVSTEAKEVNIRNDGEAELSYTLQALVDPISSLSYSDNRPPDNYLGYGARHPYLYTALKFDVNTATFNLTHVQNWYRTQVNGNRNIMMRVYKGGDLPGAGALLVQQLYEAPASATNGTMVTLPLQQPLQFRKGDVFWIVFYYSAINQPQGYHTNTPNPGRNYYSADGTSWNTLESAGGAYASATYIIKALDMPQWLSVTPVAGPVAAGEQYQHAVTVNAAGLQKGRYKGQVQVMTNDPSQPVTTVEVNLQVEELPIAGFTANETAVLPGETITFINSSENADAYEWSFEGAEPATSTLASPSVVYHTPGSYKVSLKAQNTQTGRTSDTLIKEEYIVVQPTFCLDLNSPFAGSASLATTVDGYITGTNNNRDLAKANYFNYNRADAYVTGIKIKFGAALAAGSNALIKVAVWSVQDSNGKPGNMIASKEIKLTDVAADVTAGLVTDVVFDAPVRLTGNFFAGVLLNNEPSNEVAILHNTDTTPGLAWSQDSQGNWNFMGASGPEGAELSLYIQPAITRTLTPLLADFTMSTVAGCTGEQVQLDASATVGAVRYEWLLGGAAVTSSTDLKPKVTYTTAGTYKVVLKAYDACNGVVVLSKNITIAALPDAAITVTGSTKLCEGDKAVLSAVAGDGLTYRWSNGATSRIIEISAAGSYTVTVTNATGCTSTSEAIVITVVPVPETIVAANGPLRFCEGGKVVLTAPVGDGYTYRWSNGATTRAVEATTTGEYTVTVTNTFGCDATSAATAVIVHALPDNKAIADGPTRFCMGRSVSLTAPAGNSYLWSNGATTRQIVVTTSGDYSVLVTNTAGCQAASAVTRVVVDPLPATAVTTTGSTIICQGEEVTLTAPEGSGYVYQWSNGASTRSITVDTSGSYRVSITNAESCTATSDAVVVKVNPLPNASVIADGSTTLCQGERVTLTAAAGDGYSYRWSNGATTRFIEVSSTGSYAVTVIDTNGCTATSSNTEVIVNPLPTATITTSDATTFCQGGSVVLTASEGTSYLWTNGATSRSITVSETGNYTVTVTNRNGCAATSEVVNTVMNALPSKPYIQRSDVILSSDVASGNQWFLDNTAIIGAIGAVHEATKPGVYQLQVTNASGCNSDMSATFTVTAEDLVTDVKVYPNPGEGIFHITFTGLKPDKVYLRLFDALGKVIYQGEKNMLEDRNFKLDISGTAAGMYVLQIQHQGKSYSRRLIVKR